ncbi:MMPL family transporter [Paenibacillus sp. KQZ6P-2]|uniref:MMPL family transporter n=1 Tax=Paenibacillus mangrovi TaxID=2931978 RepID=A0A9X1WQ93_9BACL|nr:MMPL family transporter [Paenibacillus mangrovi]MCJ8013089.1 MMPL family transporter [Paenibacillus mangrovi]
MLKQFANTFTHFVSSRKGAWTVLISWIVIILILSLAAPSSKPYAVNSGEGSVHNDTPSTVAQQIMDEHFPTKDGLTALLVFHDPNKISDADRTVISDISKWLSSADKPQYVSAALPFHQPPKNVQDKMLSEDQTTMILNVSLQKDLQSSENYDTMQQIRDHVKDMNTGSLQMEITGPAGIASDTTTLFKNADFVLMLATIVLILVILIVIYRSPLLAVMPLIISGMVYMVVDHIIGLGGKYGWFVVEKQSLSIMMILLFAVLTDYCLFIIARFREELRKTEKHEAMKQALTHVAEPILFSGGTVLMAMIILFTAIFKPYNHFAPVFSIAMVIILIGGVTLIPALFTLLGRKAFWPFVPKVGPDQAKSKKESTWNKIGSFVTRKPAFTAGVLLVLLLASSVNLFGMKYSFNLMKSFPENISSRQGFEILEQQFPPGQLAPVTVLLKADHPINVDDKFVKQVASLSDKLKSEGRISSISPVITPEQAGGVQLPEKMLSESGQVVKLQLTLEDNPYDPVALDKVAQLRRDSSNLLKDSGFSPEQYSLHFAGQTAEQLDVRIMNQRDTIVLFIFITLFISVMLTFQARSIKMAATMILTMLLSYAGTMGLGWLIFHEFMGYDSVSYRLPVYTFVFLIALGVDYNIMLVSRIREEAKKYEWKEAVKRGVSLTGGVISSAGIILAATFCVLITQPLQELFLFGILMAMGILIDTFLVRGMMLPAILTIIGGGKRSADHKNNLPVYPK